MPVYLAVAVGGAVGALGRYALDTVIERRSFSVFPWSTFTINVTGCVLIGVVVAAVVDRHGTPLWLRLGLTVGVLGGYTTFSTFAQESLDLIEEQQVAIAALYSLGSLAAGVLAVYVGLLVGRAL